MGILGYAKIAGLATILAAAFFGYLFVKGLQDTNASLVSENTALQTAVEGLEEEQKQLEEVQQMVYEEIAYFLKVDRKAIEEVQALKKHLSEYGYREKQDRVKKSRRMAGLHLRIVNRDTGCQWVNFARVDGECKNGKFVKNDRGEGVTQ